VLNEERCAGGGCYDNSGASFASVKRKKKKHFFICREEIVSFSTFRIPLQLGFDSLYLLVYLIIINCIIERNMESK